MIEPNRTYYIFNGNVYKYKEDIIEQEASEYNGLDDDMSDWEPEGIEEVSTVELLNRIGGENLCLMWD